jgi:chorismate lyase / 3-hydroxybenzoate synthase
MLPLRPAYLALEGGLEDRCSSRSGGLPSPQRILGMIRFGNETKLEADGVLALTISLPQLEPHEPMVEVWTSATPIERGCRGDVAYSRNDEVLFGALAVERDDVEQAAQIAYGEILTTVRSAGYPHLLRVWNHVRDINRGDGDLERYRRFSSGRHEALVGAGLKKCEFPAASAVGMKAGGVAIYFIAARRPGRPSENPRQVSAYNYPREYGPRSPSFSRATTARWGGESLLFVSGTASVVGHETRYAGDLQAQLDETVRNLDAIIAASGANRAGVRLMKVYLRRRGDEQAIASAVCGEFSNASVIVLESDTCRRGLLLEIEAIAMMGSGDSISPGDELAHRIGVRC